MDPLVKVSIPDGGGGGGQDGSNIDEEKVANDDDRLLPLSSSQQPLSQEQVLNHLQTLQSRMSQMQTWAQGAAEQAQQDKLKIKTLEQQLAAAKTLQWAKQTPATTSEEASSSSSSPASATSSPDRQKFSNPRLEQIRRARQAREAVFRQRFSDAEKHQKEEEVHDEKVLVLSQKVQELERQVEQEKAKADKDKELLAQSAKPESLLQLQDELKERDRAIAKLKEESKQYEQIVEESYEEREYLQKTLHQTSKNMKTLDGQVKKLVHALNTMEERDKERAAELLNFQKSEKELQDEVKRLKDMQKEINKKTELSTLAFATEIAELRDWGDQLQYELDQLRPLREKNESLTAELLNVKNQAELLENEINQRRQDQVIMEVKDRGQTKELESLKMREEGMETQIITLKESGDEGEKYLEELQNSQEVIRNLQSIVMDLQREAEEDIKEREELMERENMWIDEVSDLKDLVKILNDALESEKEKRHDDDGAATTTEDRHPLVAFDQVLKAGESQKMLQLDLIKSQEDDLLLLQSQVYDLLEQQDSVVMEEVEETQKNMAELYKSRQSIRQLHCIIGDLQEEAEEEEQQLEDALARENEYRGQVSVLQTEVDRLSMQMQSDGENWAAQALEQEAILKGMSDREKEYENSISQLKAENNRLELKLVSKQESEDVFEDWGGGEEGYKEEILNLQAELIRVKMELNNTGKDKGESNDEDDWKQEIHLLRKEVNRLNKRLQSELDESGRESLEGREIKIEEIELESEVPLLRLELSRFVKMLSDLKRGRDNSDHNSSTNVSSDYEDDSSSSSEGEEEITQEDVDALNATSTHTGGMSTDESSIDSGFEEEISMLRNEVSRLHMAQTKRSFSQEASSSESSLGGDDGNNYQDSF